MAVIEKLIISSAFVLLTWVTLTSARSIEVDDDTGLSIKNNDPFEDFYKKFVQFFNAQTVGHFATHTLCKNHRKEFEVAMSKKLQRMSREFADNFVHSLCEKRPHSMLTLWASELFDSNSDGHIDDFEKYAFLDNNKSD